VQIWWCRGAEVLRFNINRGDCAGDCAAAKEQVQTSRCADVQRCRCGAGVKCCAEVVQWCRRRGCWAGCRCSGGAEQKKVQVT